MPCLCLTLAMRKAARSLTSQAMNELLLIILGAILLFAVVITVGIKSSKARQQSAMRDTSAQMVWRGLTDVRFQFKDLLYGVWEIGMTTVTLWVKDSNDQPVGSITSSVYGATIKAGEESFEVRPGLTWSKSAELFAKDSLNHAPLSRFEARGWIRNRRASYTLQTGSPLLLRPGLTPPWKIKPVEILQDDQAIGLITELGTPSFRIGRALILPQDIPLAVRLFVLYETSGTVKQK